MHNAAALDSAQSSVMHNAAVIKCVVSLLVRLPKYVMHKNDAVVTQALWVNIALRDHPRLEAPAIKGLFLHDVRIIHNNAAVAQ